MADGNTNNSELINRATLVAAEAMFVQGFAGLTTALIANTAATIANTTGNKSGGAGGRSGATASNLSTSSPAVTVMAAKTNKILEDILWQVSAIRADKAGTTPEQLKSRDKEKEKKSPPSRFAAVGNALVKGLEAALGPFAILGRVINSSASGFQILGAALDVVAATLAPIVLPVFITLAGAALDLSDALQGKLAPGLKQFTGFVLDVLVPVLAKLIEYFVSFIDAIAKGISMITNWSLDAPSTDNENANVILDARSRGISDAEIRKNLTEQAGDMPGLVDKAFAVADKETVRQNAERAGALKGEGEGASEISKKRSGLDDALASFRASIGPKASFSGLADVTKNAQLSALNTNPIQQKMLEAQLEANRILEAGFAGRADGDRGGGRPPIPRGTGAGEID